MSSKDKLATVLLNDKKIVNAITATSMAGHSEIPVAVSAPEPLLTASQEEYILNE